MMKKYENIKWLTLLWCDTHVVRFTVSFCMIKGYLSKTLYLSARWLKKAKNFVQDQFIFFTCISDRESHNQLPAQVYTLIYWALKAITFKCKGTGKRQKHVNAIEIFVCFTVSVHQLRKANVLHR